MFPFIKHAVLNGQIAHTKGCLEDRCAQHTRHFECVKLRAFVTTLLLSISQKLTPENVLGVSILPPILSERDLAITSAAPGRLFDACLVRPQLQAHTKAVQLAKKGQVNNVLPSCKLNETSMLRLQIVVQSTLFPKKKSARLENLSKPPQGASKLASFDTVLAVRTQAVTFFFLRGTIFLSLVVVVVESFDT